MKTIHAYVQNPGGTAEKCVCSECGDSFTQRCSLSTHIKRVHLGIRDDLTHKCIDCDKSSGKSNFAIDEKKCSFREALKEESLEKSRQFLKECPICGKRMIKGGNLKQHIQAHVKIKEL